MDEEQQRHYQAEHMALETAFRAISHARLVVGQRIRYDATLEAASQASAWQMKLSDAMEDVNWIIRQSQRRQLPKPKQPPLPDPVAGIYREGVNRYHGD